MEIAKVEPITTARALRGPFDYRLPESMSHVGVGSLLMVPFGGRRKMLGVVVGMAENSDLAPERLAEPLEALDAGATPELVRLGLWVAERYCSTPSRGLALVLPPGSGTGAPRALRARTERRAQISAEGKIALDGGTRLGERQRAALERLARAGELSGSELMEHAGADSAVLARLEERGLRLPARAGGPPAPAHRLGRRGQRAGRALGAPARLRRCGGRRSRRGRAAGASPAWRHRIGQDRGLPRGDRGGARARPRRDPAGPGDRPDPADPRPRPRATRRPGGRDPLRPLRGRALRRVAPAALAARRASASGRARPSSPRSPTSA